MRTHLDIIKDAGGPTELGRTIGVDPNTVHAWVRAESIPAAHYVSVVHAEIATFEELAVAAAARRKAKPEKARAA